MREQRHSLDEIAALDEPRILIVRTSALGDIVQGMPVLEAIKSALPHARVAWVIEEPYRALISGHLDLDVTIEVTTARWRKAPLSASTRGSVAKAVREMRAFRPHVALDLMSNYKAAVLTRLSGARHRIGLTAAARREPTSGLFINRPVPPLGPHAVERALSVLAPLGLSLPSAPHRAANDRLLSTRLHPSACRPAGMEAGGVLIHPGAGWRNKEYPAAWWGEVARRLHRSNGPRVYVVTGPGEETLGERVEIASGGRACHLPIPDLVELIGAQRASALVLAGDTGPLHLAHALGTPVLAVMGPTDPKLHGPWGAPGQVVARRLPCSYCHQRLGETRACLLQIGPWEIAEAAQAALARKGPKAPDSAESGPANR